MPMPMPLPLTRDLVLLGGGHAHALVLRAWAMAGLPGARLTLVSPEPVAPYTGMLPGLVAGLYRREELEIDLVRLARAAGARLILAPAEGIDLAARTVRVAGRPPVGWDVLSIDIGITGEMPGLPGFAEHGVPAKPLGRFAEVWEGFVARVAAGTAPPEVVVIGAGAAGVELALAIARRLARLGRGAPSVRLLERGAEALPGLSAGARRRLLGALRTAGVELLTGAAPAAVAADAVRLADGRVLPAALTVGAAGARPQAWLAGTGLPLSDGFITVGPTLQSPADPAVFAAGDCAHLSHAPRPKAGVFAVRAAPVLAANLRAALAGGRMRSFRPQRDFLRLVSTGDGRAVADRSGLSAEGRWVWRAKDRIDRRFMRMFTELPAMPAPPLPAPRALGLEAELAGTKPLCGGCGAKAGAGALAAALAALPAPRRGDLLSAPGDDAAVLAHGAGGVQLLSTDHLRAFTEDPFLMGRLAAIHALGDIWAMGGAPQVALATLILPRMSDRLLARTLTDIMAGAAEVFAAEGAEIAGGHTSLGAELVVGFTVTGLAARAVTKGGAEPGDALILTRPLGTGVILAAEMARAAPGRVVAGALAAMGRPQGAAARCLAPCARAMTDVTGFGLAGHLLEICAASGAGARIALSAVPLLPGAEALAAAGQHSSLLPANRAAVAPRAALPAGPRAELLLDPQTCGGLLAAVPAAAAPALLQALRAAGEAEAAVIGEIVAGPPVLEITD